jgi:hypothetical protein
MKKAFVFVLMLLCGRAEAGDISSCDPTSITPWTLQYVAANYGVDGSYCYLLYGNVYACNYANGAIAALVQIPTPARTVKKVCSQVADWYNCPLSGTGCVLIARVRCSGWFGINWRDQCERYAL